MCNSLQQKEEDRLKKMENEESKLTIDSECFYGSQGHPLYDCFPTGST